MVNLRLSSFKMNNIFFTQDDHYIGAPVDIWALGILLYFLVTASMPFNAGSVNVLKRIKNLKYLGTDKFVNFQSYLSTL